MKKKIEIVVYILTIILVISLIYFFVLKKNTIAESTSLTVKEMLELYDLEELIEQGLITEEDVNSLTDEELLQVLTHGHLH